MKHILRSLLAFCLFSNLLSAQNQNISNGQFFDGEPFIAINPSNPQNVVIAWMGFVFNNGTALTIRVKSSFNGGVSWSSAVNMPHIKSTYKSADVSMCFSQSGTLFLSYIDYRESPDSGGVYVCKSLDGGLSWTAPVQAIDMYADGNEKPIDRPWMTNNPSGTHVYVSSMPPSWIPAPNRPYLVVSTNGASSFQPWRYLDSTNYLVGNLIAQPMPFPAHAGQNTLHLVYPSYVSSQNIFPQFLLATSTNAGVGFQYRSIFAGTNTNQNDTAKISYKIIADPSDSLHLAFIYGNSNSGDIDIFLKETFNGGTNWTNAIRVNDDAANNGKMQDMIWADFDSDGDLAISWRDRRNGAGIGYAQASEFYYAYRHHDSLNFQPNRVLTDSLVSYNNILSQSGNDFMSMAIQNDTIYATWSDTRDGSLDVWFVRVYAPTGAILSTSLVSSGNELIQIFPNPASDVLAVKLPNQQQIQHIRLLTVSGQVVFESRYATNEAVIDLKNLPVGIYVAEVESEGKRMTQKFIRN
jgi:hypothetical protein